MVMTTSVTTLPSLTEQKAQWEQLNNLIKGANLLDRRYAYYAIKSLVVVILLVGCVAEMVLLSGSILMDLGAALLLGFVSTQYGLLAHAAIHGQIFNANRKNQIAGHVFGFGIGFSQSWWRWKHNFLHHGSPNKLLTDSDIEVNWLAFTPGQALEKTWVNRQMIKAQHLFFLPLLLLAAVSMSFATVAYLWSPKQEMAKKSRIFEWSLFLLHVGLYGALLGLFLDTWWHSIIFFVVHKASQGMYMGLVFATNHKGMEVLDNNSNRGFLWAQIPTSRNIRVPWFLHFVWGGLEYQIEHHLWPNMPESSLGKAQILVQRFCKDNNTPYRVTSFCGGIGDILKHLAYIASQVRAHDKAALRT
jgi:fatty acid desaturase